MNSLLQFLNTFSNLLQTTLFPAIEQDLGPLTGQHRALVEALGLLQMDRFVEAGRRRGRPAHNRANILRAFVAKAVFGMPHTRALLDRLQSDAVLRFRRVRRRGSAAARACGAHRAQLCGAVGRAH
jgi:hypothetical protein